jgi:hypothetical protein
MLGQMVKTKLQMFSSRLYSSRMDSVELLGYLSLIAMVGMLVMTSTEELEALRKCEASYSNQRRKHVHTSSSHPIASPITIYLYKS